MRDAFADAILACAQGDGDLLVLDADNATSTRTVRVADALPAQFLNVGIAEQNLIGIAGGLALDGRRPVANAFAAMLSQRAYDQVVNVISYQQLPVVVVGHYAGLSAGPEGAVHHSLFDLGLMSALPGMHVEVPAFDDDVDPCLRRVLAQSGPAYLRLTRNPVGPSIPSTTGSLEHGWRTWGDGDAEVVVVALGASVGQALSAQSELAASGRPIDVVGINQLTPSPAGIGDVLRGRRLVLTLEEHTPRTGLAATIGAAVPGTNLVSLGIDGTFTESGSWSELQHAYDVDADAVVARITKEAGGTE